MKTRTVTAGILLAGALALGATARDISAFDRAMEPILSEYLTIQMALAANETDGIEGAVHAIDRLARKLDPEMASGDHAEHYKKIPSDILAACARLREANEIRSMREAFKDLSKPVSMWVTMAKPKGKSVMYCSMEKAGWVQDGTEVANPYLGPKMLSCGQKVGGAE
jgi:Cu(I)/Ag(I) efflux system membrane fusion protein